MNSTVMYSIVNKHGTYDILPVDSTENNVYQDLCLAVSTKDLDKVLQIFESKEPTYTVVNQPIFLCNTECAYTNCIALNLCHFAVYNDCKDILEVLLKNGGDLSQKTFEVTLSKNTRHFVEKDSLVDLIVRHFNEPVKYLQDIFDQYICSSDLGSTYEFQFDFSILCPSFNMKKHLRQSDRQMCVLNEIVNSSYDIYSPECGLLQHPLIETYLTCKWSHYRRFFYILVALHVFFVACLSSIALLIVGNFHTFSKLQNSTLEIESFEEGRVDRILVYIKVLNCLLLALGFLLFGHALIQTFFIPLRRLFYEFEILSNLFTSGLALLICTFGIVFPMQSILRNHLKLMYTFNSLTILPAWIDLMLIIGRIPSLGCYSLMFTTVMKNFLKVMISFVFLIIGFALSFSLVFPMSEVFNNPLGAVLRTFVMMLGEFNFSETFAVNAQFLNGLSKFIFVLFIVSCSIILMNLTQGIAVNDIKLLHEISQIVRLEKETRFLYEFESIFTQEIMTSNPALRKIKRRLYDAGAIKSEVTISSNARQGVSQALFAKLIQLYKPTRRLSNSSPHHLRFHFKCFADRYSQA